MHSLRRYLQDSPLIVIDDQPEASAFITTLFSMIGVRNNIHVFHDPRQAWQFLTSCWDAGSALPLLLLSDINMPGQNGLDFLAQVRADSRFDPVAIAMLSSSADKKQIDAAYIYGADIFVEKYPGPLALRTICTRILKSRAKLMQSQNKAVSPGLRTSLSLAQD